MISIEQLNQDYERLKSDKRAWQEELQERAALEKTLKDGLDGLNDF